MQERLIQSPRKHYEQPQIIVHGEIATMTESVTKNINFDGGGPNSNNKT